MRSLRLHTTLPTRSKSIKVIDYRYQQDNWRDHLHHKYWFNRVRGNQWDGKRATGPMFCYILVNPIEAVAEKMTDRFKILFECTTDTAPNINLGIAIMAYEIEYEKHKTKK